MTPTHEGALQVTRESLHFLRSAIEDLPKAALDWQLLPGVSSLAVLVVHSVTATRFFLSAGSGQIGSLADYRSGERAARVEDNTVGGCRADDGGCSEEPGCHGWDCHRSYPLGRGKLTLPTPGTTIAAAGRFPSGRTSRGEP